MGRSGAARRHARMADASAPAAAHAHPHPAGQTPQRATTSPQQQDSAVFSVDDASTWVAFLRCSSEPYLDFYVALKQRFAVPWTQAGTAAERALLHRSLLSLSVLVLGLVAAKSDAELESALTACRAAYEVLAETDRAAQGRAAQNTTAPKTTVAAPAPQQQQQRQSFASSAFSADDPDTWVDFMRGSANPYEDMRSALLQRFVAPLEAFLPSENARSLTLMIEKLTVLAICLPEVESQEDLRFRLHRCKEVCDKLKDITDRLQEKIANAAPSGKTQTQHELQLKPPPQQRQPQQQQSRSSASVSSQTAANSQNSFSLEDPTTWLEFLRQSNNPCKDFRDALEQRYTVPWRAVLLPEDMPAINMTLDTLATKATELLTAESKRHFQRILEDCKEGCEILKRTDRRVKEALAQVGSNGGMPTQQQQSRSAPATGSQPSSPSRKTPFKATAQPTAAFSVDDPKTWVDFVRRSKSPQRKLRSALEKRFVVSFMKAHTNDQKTFVEDALLKVPQLAVRLASAPSQKEADLLLAEITFTVQALDMLDTEMKKAIARVKAPRAGSAQSQSRPTDSAAQQSQSKTKAQGGFTVDDPSTWSEFLQRSASPYYDFYDALEQRYSFLLSKATDAEDKAWVCNAFDFVCTQAVALMWVVTEMEALAIIMLCGFAMKKLEDLEDAFRKIDATHRIPPPTVTQLHSQPAQSAPPSLPQPVPATTPPPPPSGNPSLEATAPEETRTAQQTIASTDNPFRRLGKYKRGFYPEGYEEGASVWLDFYRHSASGKNPIDWFKAHNFYDDAAFQKAKREGSRASQ